MERMKEIEARLSEISAELENDGADIDALELEVRNLKTEKAEIEKAEKRNRVKDAVSQGSAGEVVKRFHSDMGTEKRYDASSPEYRSAWLKNLAVDAKGNKIFGDMTKEERAAFTFTTANTGEVVPTEILNRIVTLIDNDSPIYDDSYKTNFRYGFSVPRLTDIAAGDAKNVSEGAANDDEQDNFDSIDLPGVEIKKHIVMSRKMQFQSIQAFEDPNNNQMDKK